MNYPIAVVVCLGVSVFLHIFFIPFLHTRKYKRGPFPLFRKITYLRIFGFYQRLFLLLGLGYLSSYLLSELIKASYDDVILYYPSYLAHLSNEFSFFNSIWVHLLIIGLCIFFTLIIYGYSHMSLMKRFRFLRSTFNKDRIDEREILVNMLKDKKLGQLEADLEEAENSYLKLSNISGFGSEVIQTEDELLEAIDYLMQAIYFKKLLNEEEIISLVIQQDVYHEIERQIQAFLWSGIQAWKAFFSGRYLKSADSRKRNVKYIVAVCLLIGTIWIIQAGQCVHYIATNYVDGATSQMASQDFP